MEFQVPGGCSVVAFDVDVNAGTSSINSIFSAINLPFDLRLPFHDQLATIVGETTSRGYQGIITHELSVALCASRQSKEVNLEPIIAKATALESQNYKEVMWAVINHLYNYNNYHGTNGAISAILLELIESIPKSSPKYYEGMIYGYHLCLSILTDEHASATIKRKQYYFAYEAAKHESATEAD